MAEMNEMRGNLKTAQAVMAFMFGGNATLTVKSVQSGTSYTFKVSQAYKKDEQGNTTDEPEVGKFFVSLLTGSDNESDFSYCGLIVEFKKFFPKKDLKNAPSVKGFAWVFERLVKDHLPTNVEIWHEGRCGRCGRKLTVVESIENGFGPDCIEKVSAFAVMANQLANMVASQTPTPAPEAEAPKPEPPKAHCTQCGTETPAAELACLEEANGDFCPKCRIMITSLARSQGWTNGQTIEILKTKKVITMPSKAS